MKDRILSDVQNSLLSGELLRTDGGYSLKLNGAQVNLKFSKDKNAPSIEEILTEIANGRIINGA